jgi:hypothetical protein
VADLWEFAYVVLWPTAKPYVAQAALCVGAKLAHMLYKFGDSAASPRAQDQEMV